MLRTYDPSMTPMPSGYSGACEVLKNCGAMMLLMQYAAKTTAFVVTFFVCPAVFALLIPSPTSS